MANQHSYKQIFKSTSLFGGVQIIQILITIIRSKAVALLLGPAGMGINALLQSSIGIVGSLTNFGLSTSAVKDIAHAHGTGDEEKIGRAVAVFRRWVWITGGLGFILTLVMAPWLSKLAFNNKKYTISFIVISITLLIGQLIVGQGVVLQGLRKLKYMAASSVLGSAIGLLTSMPLYYFLGAEGIVPAIIVTSVTGLFISRYFASKVPISRISVGWQETWERGKGMLQLGFMLSLSVLIAGASTYVLRVFISQQGGLEQVGFYNAGFAIIDGYVGMIFSAMAVDYYPRLTSLVNDKVEMKHGVSQQAEIAILILGPLLSIFMVFASLGVIALYTREFLPITRMLIWASLGVLFKAFSWAVGFIFLAKGSSKTFFLNEFVANLYVLALNVIGYYYYGLSGLGISFLVGYILYLTQVMIVSRRLYDFNFPPKTIRLFVGQSAFLGSTLAAVLLLDGIWKYVVGSTIAMGCMVYTLMQFQQRIDISSRLKVYFYRR